MFCKVWLFIVSSIVGLVPIILELLDLSGNVKGLLKQDDIVPIYTCVDDYVDMFQNTYYVQVIDGEICYNDDKYGDVCYSANHKFFIGKDVYIYTRGETDVNFIATPSYGHVNPNTLMWILFAVRTILNYGSWTGIGIFPGSNNKTNNSVAKLQDAIANHVNESA